MPVLTAPSARYRRSFLEAVKEFHADTDYGLSWFVTDIDDEALADEAGFDAYVARRQGHATAMLRAALPIAAGFGVAEALLTCDDTNVASRRVIESCGGRFIDQVEGKLRFWVPTS